MLLGTAVTLLLRSMHILSYGWALAMLFLIIVGGMMQHFLYRNRNCDRVAWFQSGPPTQVASWHELGYSSGKTHPQ